MLWFWRGLLSWLRIPSNKFMSKMIIITLIDVNNGSMCDRWQAKRLKGCKLSRELLNKKFISNRKTRSRRIFSLSRDREREREREWWGDLPDLEEALTAAQDFCLKSWNFKIFFPEGPRRLRLRRHRVRDCVSDGCRASNNAMNN